MNSRWMVNRIGLVDFWYYGDQEYEFIDGRMLLRGPNGSGKSVTMQSFIPLILDGNTQPERIDPFGSRARKMDNYLLEEDDDREERTGYLYMEFKRADAERFLTVGIGLYAKRGKQLDKWYFSILDNRRIGKDFYLYRETHEKLVLTKKELTNRIGEGGSVLTSQNEYMQMVNKLLFGFETVEEYKELLELLIQLRTPKLSKEFKPSVINEILSKSLQTLSEDDLRPMSEAIENMDSIETNLTALKDSVDAAKRIQRVYNRYNRAVLWDKADLFICANKDFNKMKKELSQAENNLKEADVKLAENEKQYDMLDQEYRIVDEEYRQLRDSDIARLKENEEVYRREIKEAEEKIRLGEENKTKKNDELIQQEYGLKEHQGICENSCDNIKKHLGEIQSLMDAGAYDEWQYVIKEVADNMSDEYDYDYPEKNAKDYRKVLKLGLDAIKEEERQRKIYDASLRELEEKKAARQLLEKQQQQYDEQQQEQKEELIEKIHIWSSGNHFLKLEPEELQHIDRAVNSYQYGDDYSSVKEIVEYRNNKVGADLQIQYEKAKADKEALWQHARKLSDELQVVKNEKKIEPGRSAEVIANREKLRELNIPVLPLYETIDFDKFLTEEQCNRLEASLSQMGLLDALVMSTDYREQILELDGKLCDKYLFTDMAKVNGNIMDLFVVENGENDIVLYMQVEKILSGIGTKNAQATTWIDKNGHYRIGILEGTSSSDYVAKYIGSTARERHRQQLIKELEAELSECEKNILEYNKVLEDITEKENCLKAEFTMFPNGEDMKTACRDYEDAVHRVSQADEDVKRKQEILYENEKQLKESSLIVEERCGKIELVRRIDVYEGEMERIENYIDLLHDIHTEHQKYLASMEIANNIKERIEGLQEDLDYVLYDLGKLNVSLEERRGRLKSVEEQMKIAGYDEIKKRIEYCLAKLNDQTGIPKQKRELYGENERLKQMMETLKEIIVNEKEELIKKNALMEYRKNVFEKEYDLSYVECGFVKTNDLVDMANKVIATLRGLGKNDVRQDLMNSLQEVFHENKGVLNEYQPMFCKLFEELVEDEDDAILVENTVRWDIKANYRGVAVSFNSLVDKLISDVDELENLLSEKDRELFEDILSNTISKKIRAKIYESKNWVSSMNDLMESMNTSSGLSLSLKWKPKKSEKDGQLDTSELVDLLQTDAEIMRQEDIDKISMHFRSCIAQARSFSREENTIQTFYTVMKDILDYRKWFEFQLLYQKTGEKKREMTDRKFFTFSGGEKAMSMYVPLFSAVVAKYNGASKDAPRIISLDEAFAGVDEMNIKDMFRLMIQLELNFIINSQVLWGDYDTIPSLAIYHLIRPGNEKCVTVMKYIWNGKTRSLV